MHNYEVDGEMCFTHTTSVSSKGIRFADTGESYTYTPDVQSIVAAVKKSLGMERVLEKCLYCGQWGAVMCACPSCGHPIDPK